jgi:flagellar motor switch protein FliN/FliY
MSEEQNVGNMGHDNIRASAFKTPAVENTESNEAKSPDIPVLDTQAAVASDAGKVIELLRDVELDVKIELGRARMLIDDVLKLCEGSVVELDKLAGDPVDILVNNKLVARGEVIVLNDNFCVRINDIVSREFDREEKH